MWCHDGVAVVCALSYFANCFHTKSMVSKFVVAYCSLLYFGLLNLSTACAVCVFFLAVCACVCVMRVCVCVCVCV
jgi:hypothetical protein